ncbi:MAG: ABC transporter substrate-binding protein [Chloroflexi bacterium]|nr:ABC transporter substrate-binding protein [Chloroflexota bacterium]
MGTRKSVFLGAVLGMVLALLVASACNVQRAGSPASPTKVSVALDWYPWGNHAGLFTAREKGYYSAQGLEVNLYTPADPSTVLQTVGAGRDDFGISYQVEVLLARAAGVPVVSIAALVQHPLNSVMALKGSGITRPRDLVGKKVGYPGIPYNEPMLKTMVEKDGGDFKKVELVNVGFDLVPALLSKKMDAVVGAYWVHESILIEQQGYEVVILRMEEWGVPDFYELVLVTSEKTLKERHDMVHHFLAATLKGYRDAAADQQAALETLAKASPEVDRAVESKGIPLLAPLWKDRAPAFGWQSAERWRSFAKWMEANKLLDKPIDANAAFTNGLVEELSE